MSLILEGLKVCVTQTAPGISTKGSPAEELGFWFLPVWCVGHH